MKIKCTHCGEMMELTDAMLAPALAEVSAKSAEAIAVAEKKLRSTFEIQIKATEIKLDEAVASVRRQSDLEVSGLKGKLVEAQQAQADAIRHERAVAEREQGLDLEIQKGISAGVSAVRDSARKEAEAAASLKIAERDALLASALSKAEDLQKKLDQGSQQVQGEVFEVALEDSLRKTFPLDSIVPVPKGSFGGDLIQSVSDGAGTIIWELKRTKNWSDGWLAKLRGDQRAAKADVAVIVSFTMPEGIELFGQMEGVWVCSPDAYIPLCLSIRAALFDVRAARRSMDGMKTKAESVYEYLTSPQFKNRVGAIIEAFSNLKEQLDSERKAYSRIWSKREETITRVIESTGGMYGDLQAIAGKALEEIPALSL